MQQRDLMHAYHGKELRHLEKVRVHEKPERDVRNINAAQRTVENEREWNEAVKHGVRSPVSAWPRRTERAAFRSDSPKPSTFRLAI